MALNSSRSSAEDTAKAPKDSASDDAVSIDPTINSELHATKNATSNDKLELGNPDNVIWTTSFGEGEMESLKIGGGIDPVFEAKAAVVNRAIQHIGMGKYQWKLFVLCG